MMLPSDGFQKSESGNADTVTILTSFLALVMLYLVLYSDSSKG